MICCLSGGARELESEETFVQYVGATQDLASTHLAPPKGSGGRKKTRRSSNEDDKVAKWLIENQGQLKMSKAKERAMLSPKKRENLAQDLCQALIRNDAEDKASRQPQESRRKSRRRTSSIMENASALFNSPRARLTSELNNANKNSNKANLLSQPSFGSSMSSQRNIRRSVAGVLNFLDNDDDDVFFKPASSNANSNVNMEETECVGGIERAKTGGGLVDFSSDSAKALIAQYEAKMMAGDSSGTPASESDPKEQNLEVANEEEEEGLPATQPSLSLILQGVTAYVEFRTGHENRSRCVEEVLESMGATVAKKLGKDVTHMVFKDGALATYNKGKKLGIHIVSNMWVEACKNEGTKVSEGLFPSISKAK